MTASTAGTDPGSIQEFYNVCRAWFPNSTDLGEGVVCHAKPFDQADGTGFEGPFLAVPDMIVGVSHLLLRIFITYWLDSHVHGCKPDIEKHRIRFVTVAQVIHILIKKLEDLSLKLNRKTSDDVEVEVQCQFGVVKVPNVVESPHAGTLGS